MIEEYLKSKIPTKVKLRYKYRGMSSFVISYPKCGRTWLRTLIGKYLSDIYELDLPYNELSEVQTYHEHNNDILSIDFLHYMDPHLTHIKNIDFSFYPLNNKKLIFLVRDPRSTSVSFYYQFMFRGDKEKSELSNFDGNIDDFVLGEYGGIRSIIKYYNIWAEKVIKDEVLLIRYEDMRINTFGEILNILNYLGLPVDRNVLSNSIEFCMPDNLKELEKRGELNEYRFGGSDENNRKVRKPNKSDWSDEVKEETRKEMNELMVSNLSDVFGYV